MILGVDHISLLIADTQKSVAFYQDILGLESLPRPDLGFPGAWLSLGAQQTLHLLELENPYDKVERPMHGGRDMHFALSVQGIEVYERRLEARQMTFSKSKSGRKALFFKDLDKNVIELYEV